MPELTYRQAARRVHRSIKTIKRWRRNGMPMGWANVQGQRCRVVDETTLLAWWRGRLKSDPVHQARIRKSLLDNGSANPMVVPNASTTPHRSTHTSATINFHTRE